MTKRKVVFVVACKMNRYGKILINILQNLKIIEHINILTNYQKISNFQASDIFGWCPRKQNPIRSDAS